MDVFNFGAWQTHISPGYLSVVTSSCPKKRKINLIKAFDHCSPVRKIESDIEFVKNALCDNGHHHDISQSASHANITQFDKPTLLAPNQYLVHLRLPWISDVSPRFYLNKPRLWFVIIILLPINLSFSLPDQNVRDIHQIHLHIRHHRFYYLSGLNLGAMLTTFW